MRDVFLFLARSRGARPWLTQSSRSRAGLTREKSVFLPALFFFLVFVFTSMDATGRNR